MKRLPDVTGSLKRHEGAHSGCDQLSDAPYAYLISGPRTGDRSLPAALPTIDNDLIRTRWPVRRVSKGREVSVRL